MISKNAKLLLVGLAWLALWPTPTLAQSGSWESYMAAGAGAYAQNDYAEAERQFLFALGVASLFRPQDPRLGTSLDRLAVFYQARGRYAEAEPLHKRSLAIRERALGPDHPGVAIGLSMLVT